jgi:hypothetical protein
MIADECAHAWYNYVISSDRFSRSSQLSALLPPLHSTAPPWG